MYRPAVEVADGLYEDVRELSVAVMGRAVPAPELYKILGNMKWAGGHFLEELFGRLADGIERSIDEFDVYEAWEGDPAANAVLAATMLQGAAQHAAKIAQLLEAAQTAINGQGHHGRRSETASA